MASQTNENALENAIETTLLGKPNPNNLQEIGNDYAPQRYQAGDPNHYNAQYALDTQRFWNFLDTTQSEALDKLKRHPDWQLKILQRYDRLIKKNGLLHLLRKGLHLDDSHLTLFYQPPTASSSQIAKQRYQQNQFSVTRQVRYNPDNPNERIDLVLFINGIPIVTLELKNPWTEQTAKQHGIKQYQRNRDPRQPLLQFARALVHFAVDPYEAYMTTKLVGSATVFLPFNQGHHHGQGNPPNPHGYQTAYLWEDILRCDSLANIIQHFVRLDGEPSKPLASRTLYFPRYHQLDVVRKLIDHTAHHGTGHRYLIQHSAGSGKSNSITWAAYQLIEVHPYRPQNGKTPAQPLFDSVIVVTDRRLLDKQLRDTITQFSDIKNIVAPAHSAKQLQDNLEQGKKIIITTLQKFPYIVDGIADLSHKNFAVIIDEAHSSQGGTAASTLNQAMGDSGSSEDSDAQDTILHALQTRKMKGNAAYFAFTATPKNTTLEKFGTPQADGSFQPFHLYAMKQAIEEGFILDVLANYTTYQSYYEIAKSIQANPLFDSHKAQRKLRNFVESHPDTIATKADIILEHFINHVYSRKKLQGQAKGMVITQSIAAAIHYYQALKQRLAEKNHPFKLLIAFSGKKTINGIEHTEASLNGFSDNNTRDKFDQAEYRLLVVANKYLTGFDQPKLCTLYVDKRLQGVLAVQALSRLNRAASKYGKRTEDLFILDFFNTTDDIKTAFDPFYTATRLNEATDVNVLHDLKDSLDAVGVYEWHEVQVFTGAYFANAPHEQLAVHLQAASERFNYSLALDHSAQADFKIKAKQFVKIYAQIAALLPYEISDWEYLFWFLKFLLPTLKLQRDPDAVIDELLDAVDLATYSLERTKLNHSIALDAADSELNPQNPNPRGAHSHESQQDTLDAIIQAFNEKWSHNWDVSQDEKTSKLLSLAQHTLQHPDHASKYANNPDPQNSDIAFTKIAREVMLEQRRRDIALYRLYSEDESFRQGLVDTLKRLAAVIQV